MSNETDILATSDRYDAYTLDDGEAKRLNADHDSDSIAALYDCATSTMYLNPGLEAEMEITEHARDDQDGRVKILGKDSWQSDSWWGDILDRSRSREIGLSASEDLIESYNLI